MMHVLIVGEVGVGKSTLIRKLLEGLETPCGFITKKEPQDESANANIYIHSPALPWHYGEDNRVGVCSAEGATPFWDVFDRMGVKLLQEPAQGRVVLMDELGFLESKAEKFCAEVLRALDGPDTVVAAVKPKDTEFLLRVRSHPKARCYPITFENRDRLKDEILRDLAIAFPASPLVASRPLGACRGVGGSRD
ncbi:MAG: nucleoside-triphosphatase [Bacillota bacterium]